MSRWRVASKQASQSNTYHTESHQKVNLSYHVAAYWIGYPVLMYWFVSDQLYSESRSDESSYRTLNHFNGLKSSHVIESCHIESHTLNSVVPNHVLLNRYWIVVESIHTKSYHIWQIQFPRMILYSNDSKLNHRSSIHVVLNCFVFSRVLSNQLVLIHVI